MARQRQAAAATIATKEIQVSFGGASTGDRSRRLGVSIARDKLTLAKANEYFCGKQIGGTITARANGGSNQESLPGADQDPLLTSTFEVKGYGVTPDAFTFGMTFVKSALPDGTLDPFANKEGVLCIEDVSAIPEGSESEEEADGEE